MSTSNIDIHGDASHPIGHHTSHTMENGASGSSGGAPGQSGCLDASLISTAAQLSESIKHDSESDASLVTETSSSGSLSLDGISQESDDSIAETEASSVWSSIGNLSNFSIIDSTLREGEQFRTAHFNTAQKIKIAQALDDFGVEYIELTSPAASEKSRTDCEAICKLGLKAKILCHIRCNMDDARIAVQTGVDGINMCIGTSSQLMEHSHGKDMAYIAAKAKEVIEYVKSNNIEIRFSGEDSFRSDFSEILKLYTLVDQLGANRVGIADTVGGATPREVFEKIDILRQVVGCDIETHFHNDTGCAIGNAFVALEAGATHIDTTVLGIGERNGITSLGGLMACLLPRSREYILSKYKIERLGYLEHLVAGCVKMEIPFNNFVLTL